MSYAQAQKDLMAAVSQIMADHSAYPLAVEGENRAAVDQATQVNPWLKVEIKFLGADQVEVGPGARVEQWGQLWLTAVCKEGTGSLELAELIDFVVPYFELKKVGGVTCRTVTAAGGKKVNGLWQKPAIINFFYHRFK